MTTKTVGGSTTPQKVGNTLQMLQRFTPHRVCHPNPLRHYGNRLSEKSESFFLKSLHHRENFIDKHP